MILEALKNGTASIHDEIEKNNLTNFIMDGSIDQNQYETLLRQNFKVYKAVEDFVNGRYEMLPLGLKSFAGYQKTNALAKDIASFSSLPLPEPMRITGARDEATLVGKLYVIEGSMIGGMMMSKKLESCSNLSHVENHHFFNGNINEGLSRWNEFKEAVDSLNFNYEEIKTAVKSAKATFKLFKKAYNKELI